MKHSDYDQQKKALQPFGELLDTMNVFLSEKRVRGFLQTMDDFFQISSSHSSFPVHVSETKNENIITAELPGVKKEQIKLEAYASHLTISIESHESQSGADDKSKAYFRKEAFQQSSRTVALSHPIDESGITASYQDGILEVRVRKPNGKSIRIHE
ncbi:Hsp20/alpha crystallin family protein [Mesobacillus zeae]|uniref:Hsp20/alpha crystallin family protein n=1 Tax=Mesobacillus zeae TaxID=1917180 RepID=A0A398B2Q4_9BACI|nr:Hsp20/alpha crystallin family protein [Mesobacillus zeae]RID84209.1 Hsp20/alpha crystallin family protein [Mesobacillus zeae]